MGETPPLNRTQLDGRTLANVLWLVDPPGWNDALVVGRHDGSFSGAMSVRFTSVEVAAWPDSIAPDLPFPSGRFDLLAIDAQDAERTERLAGRDGTQAWVDLLTEARRVLRDDGVLLMGGANPRWFRNFLPPRGLIAEGERALRAASRRDLNAMSAGAVLALLRDFGWSDPMVLSADPSSDDPRHLFPASRRAARANERMTRRRSLTTRLRLVVVALGRHELLYPARLFVASR